MRRSRESETKKGSRDSEVRQRDGEGPTPHVSGTLRK